MYRKPRRSAAVAALAAFAVACGSSSGTAAAPLPSARDGWWRERTVYQVFVRSFKDSDGDGIGDLRGLAAMLPTLNDGDPATDTDLGVGALWLMPIFASPSYHGYDVTDYRAVNPQYGTLADFDALLAAAHARGIKIILDMVPNHTSSAHPWFANARTGTDAQYRNYYVWSAADPRWFGPQGQSLWYATTSGWYYGFFSPTMPDLNWANAAVEADILAAMRFWLDRGVDGFRLDAVRYLVENGSGLLADQAGSHAVLKRMRAALSATHPDVLLVGEAWTVQDTVSTYYGDGDELQLAFTFDVAAAVVEAARTGSAGPVINAAVAADQSLAGKDRGFQAPFLTNHDQVRFLRQTGGDPATARVGAATLFALPGTPFVYYGEELGMQGGAGGDDKNKRTPMRWTSTGPGYGFTDGSPWFTAPEAAGVDVTTQRADPGSLWNLYRRLIAFRAAHPILVDGALSLPAVTGGGDGVLALLRGDPTGRKVLLVANYGASATGALQVQAAGAISAILAADPSITVAPSGGGLAVAPLPPRGFALVALD